MTTTNQNLTVWQGEDKTITVSLVNGAGAAYGSTVGITFYWMVAVNSSSAALISKNSAAGITNGTSQIEIDLDDTDTEDLAAGSYYHECRAVDGSGEEDVVFTGGFLIKPSITNP